MPAENLPVPERENVGRLALDLHAVSSAHPFEAEHEDASIGKLDDLLGFRALLSPTLGPSRPPGPCRFVSVEDGSPRLFRRLVELELRIKERE